VKKWTVEVGWTAGVFVLIVLAGLRAWAAPVEPASAPAPPTLEAGQELGKLSGIFRRYRADAKRRAEAVKQMTAAGSPGIATARDLIDHELRRLAAGLDGRWPTAAWDQKIQQLREVLAKLRADPELTRQKIEQVGVPALSALTVLYGQRQSQLLRYQARFAGARRQLEQLAEMLRLLQAAWKGAAAPLPVPDYLQQTEQLLAKIVDPEYEQAQQIMAENAQLAGQLDPKTLEGMRGLDQLRVVCGLKPLAIDLKLCQAATGHSADMQLHKFFAHKSPLPGKTMPEDRARLAGTTASGENIYMGSVSSASAGKAWFLSPGHHKNMLNENHRRQGLGRSGNYWTHLFGP
jgi:uncharacterized protein YkwD